tara:strand:- start:10123 stop:13332 length:3210 start_codon:yes stop_codon:yes gene_type:complete
MSWYLSQERANFLEEEIETLINKHSDTDPTHRDLIYHSKRLTDLIKTGKVHNYFSIYIVWFFHRARQNEKYLKILELFTEYFLEKINESENPNEDLIALSNTLILIFYPYFKKSSLIIPTIESCLTDEEKEKIKKKIEYFEEQSFFNEDALYLDDQKQKEIISEYKDSAQFEKLEKQLEFLLDLAFSNDEDAALGKAPINYLLEKRDIIPDDYGIFGLVDDIYAIDQSYTKLRKINDHDGLIQNFNIKNQNFSIPFISDENSPLSLANVEDIVKVSLSKKEDFFKRLIVLRDIGPIPIFIALSKAIIQRQNSEKGINEEFCLEKGKNYIFFDTAKEKKIVAKYAGKVNEEFFALRGFPPNSNMINNNMHAIFTDKDEYNIQYIEEDLVELAQPTEKKTSASKTIKLFFNNEYKNEISNPWTKYNFPKKINSIQSKGSIFILGQKNKIREYLNISLFNKPIYQWLGARIFKKDGNYEDLAYDSNQIFPDPYIYLYSDPDRLIESLDNYWHQNVQEHAQKKPELIVICEDHYLENEYLLNNLYQQETDVILLSSFVNNFNNKKANAVGFDQIPLQTNDYVNNVDISGLDPVSRFFSRSGKFKSSTQIFENDLLEKFYYFKEEMKGYFKEERYSYLRIYFYKIILNLQNRVIPLNQEEEESFKKDYKIMLKELDVISYGDSKIQSVFESLKDLETQAVDYSKYSEIKKFCIENSSKQNLILCHLRQKKRLNKILFEDELNARAETFTNIEKDIIKGKIFSAIAQSNAISLKLKSTRYADEICFLVNDTEKKSLDLSIKKINQYFESYFQNDGTSSSIDYDYSDVTSTLTEELVDHYHNSARERFSGNKDSEMEARMFIFDEGKVFLTPKAHQNLCIPRNGSQVDYKASNLLKSGDKIVIAESISGNEILHLLMDSEEKNSYPQVEESAQRWQDELKKYANDQNYSYKELTEKLQENGVSKHIATVKSWLNDPETIMPRSQDDLFKIFKLVGLNDKDIFEKCYKMCQRVYSLRKLCRQRLISKIRKIDLSGSEETFSITVNEQDLSFNIYEIEAIKDINAERSHMYKLSKINI